MYLSAISEFELCHCNYSFLFIIYCLITVGDLLLELLNFFEFINMFKIHDSVLFIYIYIIDWIIVFVCSAGSHQKSSAYSMADYWTKFDEVGNNLAALHHGSPGWAQCLSCYSLIRCGQNLHVSVTLGTNIGQGATRLTGSNEEIPKPGRFARAELRVKLFRYF